MTLNRQIVRFFLASPSDLQEERNLVRSVFSEFNANWANALGFQAELVGWEDTIAGYGRPQELINKDLETCDFFIGMLWKRWGTPPTKGTGEFTSGFHEEFSISIRKREQTGRPEISVYFKDVSRENLADPGDELKKVLKFKADTQEQRKVLYDHFVSTEELRQKLTTLISKNMQKLAKSIAAHDIEEEQSSVVGSKSVARTDKPVLSTEGIDFLMSFVKGLESGEQGTINALSVSRFRLIGDLIHFHGNDDRALETHDSNMLFADRDKMHLGQDEVFALILDALHHYSGESVPLWHWLLVAGMSRPERVYLFTQSSMPEGSRLGALRVMALSGEPIGANTERRKLIESWFEDTPLSIRIAALDYLRYFGIFEDLDVLYAVEDKSGYQVDHAFNQCVISILLRHHRDDALQKIIELQPVSLEHELVDSAFANPADVDNSFLSLCLNHRNGHVRKHAAVELIKREALSLSDADRLMGDDDPSVRSISLRYLEEFHRSFSLDEAQKVIAREQAGLSLLDFRRPSGAQEYREYKWDKFLRLSKDELQAAIETSTLLDETAFFVDLFRRKDIEGLRVLIKDQNMQKRFDERLSSFAQIVGQSSPMVDEVRAMKDRIISKWRDEAIYLLCRIGRREDLRVLRVSLGGTLLYPLLALDFLAKHGEWSDISLIISQMAESNNCSGDVYFGGVEKAPISRFAETILKIGKGREHELLSTKMPSNLLRECINGLEMIAFKRIEASLLLHLLQHETPIVRKVLALKIILALPKSSIRRLLATYMEFEQRYYNTIHWLDMGVSLDRVAARAIAKSALNSIALTSF